MLYSVPERGFDDWYWILATIHKNISKPVYVVTNDLMRDHRISFLEPRAFFRWRTSQVVYFTIEREWKDFTTLFDNGNDKSIPTDEVSRTQISNYVLNGKNHPLSLRDDMKIGGQTHLFLPGKTLQF
jgi:hypothetical protein